MRTPLVIGVILTFLLPSQGQEWIRCYAHELYEEQMSRNPEFRKNQEELERYTREYVNRKAQDGNTYYIPTVFHVIHNGDPVGTDENLSSELLLAQLEQLNLDFALENSNYNQAPLAFRLKSADTRIQFCLASETPQGNQTSGIVRTNISSLGVNENSCWDGTFIDANIKPALIWDQDKYLNIFILGKLELQVMQNQQLVCLNKLLGYAQFPGEEPETDAIVVLAASVGSRSLPNPEGNVFDQGRTATHEVGHWLNLLHIWGDDQFSGDICAGSDQVSDTPNQAGPTYGCPQFPAFDACNMQAGGAGKMSVNFMDYTNDECMYLFSKGQGSHMRAAITGSRSSLIATECCPSHPENRWVGPFTGNWYGDSNNWSLGRTPMPCDKVVINSPSRVSLNNNEVGYGYEIETGSGAQLTLNNGAELCLGEVQY